MNMKAELRAEIEEIIQDIAERFTFKEMSDADVYARENAAAMFLLISGSLQTAEYLSACLSIGISLVMTKKLGVD